MAPPNNAFARGVLFGFMIAFISMSIMYHFMHMTRKDPTDASNIQSLHEVLRSSPIKDINSMSKISAGGRDAVQPPPSLMEADEVTKGNSRSHPNNNSKQPSKDADSEKLTAKQKQGSGNSNKRSDSLGTIPSDVVNDSSKPKQSHAQHASLAPAVSETEQQISARHTANAVVTSAGHYEPSFPGSSSGTGGGGALSALFGLFTSRTATAVRPVLRRFPGDAKGTITKASMDVGSSISANQQPTRDSSRNSDRGEDNSQAQNAIVTSTSNEFGQGGSESFLDSFLTTLTVTATKNDKPFTLDREQCNTKYGTRRFFPDSLKRLPPMLYTFPGSGNTWGRLLIERATGIYTGSVYNDKTLLEALPGEFTCDWSVSVVKVHPHTHIFQHLHDGSFNSDANKCKRGGVKRFERAVLLIRNPFDSIWSEYQRRVTQSHVTGIPKAKFDWPRWQANAAALSNAYANMWGIHYAGIMRKYARHDTLVLRYEDLKNKTKRADVLGLVAKFLKVPVPKERLECAFLLAESRQAHRSIDKSKMMTKELAYTKPLACKMWALFGKHASRHGYAPWNNWDCSGFDPVPKINVGPQGEYNRKWVKPGAPLIDFGGHEGFNYTTTTDHESGRGDSGDEPPLMKRPGKRAVGMWGGGGGGGGGGRVGKGGGKKGKGKRGPPGGSAAGQQQQSSTLSGNGAGWFNGMRIDGGVGGGGGAAAVDTSSSSGSTSQGHVGGREEGRGGREEGGGGSSSASVIVEGAAVSRREIRQGGGPGGTAGDVRMPATRAGGGGGGGMTLEEASSVSGVGNVGKQKPAWQSR